MFAWIPNPVNPPQNHHVCIRNRCCVNIFLSLANNVAVITCQCWKVNFCIVVLSNYKRLFLKVSLFPKKKCVVQFFFMGWSYFTFIILSNWTLLSDACFLLSQATYWSPLCWESQSKKSSCCCCDDGGSLADIFV